MAMIFALVPLLTVASCTKVLFTSESCSFFILFSMRISHYLSFSVSLTQALQENKCYFLKFWLLQSRGCFLSQTHFFFLPHEKIDLPKNTQNRNKITLWYLEIAYSMSSFFYLFLLILFMFFFFNFSPFLTEDEALLGEYTEDMAEKCYLAFSVCATEILRTAVLIYGLNCFLQPQWMRTICLWLQMSVRHASCMHKL